MKKLYKNREWLYRHYITQEEPAYAMAKEAGCSQDTIYRWCHKLGVPIYTYGGGVYCNRDWLWKHYIIQKESINIMAKEAECGYTAIRRELYKNKIPIRSSSEGAFLAKRNFLTLSSELLGLLEGELLGDGCVTMMRSYSARYGHTAKYEEYLIWLSEQFAALGLMQSGQIIKRQSKQSGFYGAVSYCYKTKSYPELTTIRHQWYPKGKKVVPQSLMLTPIMARQWYLGDGGLYRSKRGRPYIAFSTCGFDQRSVKYLVKELCKFGFRATHQPANNMVGLSAYSVQDFLKWIGPCPIACYNYKWAYAK